MLKTSCTSTKKSHSFKKIVRLDRGLKTRTDIAEIL